MNTEFYDKLSVEVIRAIRGERSQHELAKKIGTSYNVFHLWETGKKKVRWGQFVKVCSFCQIDLPGALKALCGYKKKDLSAGALVLFLTGNASPKELVHILKISKSTLNRILNGQADPDINVIFGLMNWQANLVSFLEKIVDVKNIALIQDQFRLYKGIRECCYKYPEATSVIVFLESLSQINFSFNDIDSYVQRKMDLRKEKSRAILNSLEKCGALLDGDDGYHLELNKMSFHWRLEDDEEKVNNLIVFMNKRMLGFHQGKEPSLTKERIGLLTFSADKETKVLLKKEIDEFYYKMTRILQEREHLMEDKKTFLFNYNLLSIVED